jgi:hypothetical protein
MPSSFPPAANHTFGGDRPQRKGKLPPGGLIASGSLQECPQRKLPEGTHRSLHGADWDQAPFRQEVLQGD